MASQYTLRNAVQAAFTGVPWFPSMNLLSLTLQLDPTPVVTVQPGAVVQHVPPQLRHLLPVVPYSPKLNIVSTPAVPGGTTLVTSDPQDSGELPQPSNHDAGKDSDIEAGSAVGQDMVPELRENQLPVAAADASETEDAAMPQPCASGKHEGKEGIFKDCCSICLTDFDAGELVTQLPCTHVYHQPCINLWYAVERASCSSSKQG